ncbi:MULTISPECIES: TfoX/Sxy family DNA transformation protein [Lawsonibacter]|uniref:TfoX/Sxy family DNA transformation protein n=1 Tax=Lawsonibacter TaxID=2172004 RepID=UPI00258FAC02|nr:TfoX/Sxy family DNA transformation protein [Lawsonibacter sp.]MCI6397734.1 TfoX/Sxy family protein [Lawsonibacter sp.]MDY2977057.1 TfoX/Sxy family DNA transformation protein [Oscillospiraceae bacterium]
MGSLACLPNLGPVLAERLHKIGVDTPEPLRSMGSRAALIQIRAQADPNACLHQLPALEGAIRGVRKKELPDTCRTELRAFHQSLK